MSWSFNPGPSTGLGFSPFARRYSGNHCCFLFLRLLRCFSSGGSLDTPILKFSVTYLSMNPGEFPHSEISGSMLICSSPKLIAAYHVFHRLPVPRHSPCALVRLTFQTFFQNIWYPLDSLLLPTKIIVTLPFEIAIFLKRTYYNLCFAVIIQFSRYVFECPFQGPQNRTISTLLVCYLSKDCPSFDVLSLPDSLERR